MSGEGKPENVVKAGEAIISAAEAGKIVAASMPAASMTISSSSGPHISVSGAPGMVMAGGGLIGHAPVPQQAKPLEHVLLPTRLPKRVLVAFLDEDGKHEPFWAAYLDPQDIVVDMSPGEPQDAHIDLRLSLVKRHEQ